MQSAALTIFLCWAGMLLLLAFAPGIAGRLHPVGRVIEHLGQFGDAFAPVTAFFAMYAAIFAWQSYQTQRQQLEHERSRSRAERFDELFFRLLGYYEQQVRAVLWTTPASQHFPAQDFTPHSRIATFRDYWETTVQNFSIWDHDLYDPGSRFSELSKLAAQIVAIVRWFRSSAVDEHHDYARLLDANLGDNEVWFWQRSIAATGDTELISFAGSWNIFGPDRGMTEEEARAFKQPPAHVDPYLSEQDPTDLPRA